LINKRIFPTKLNLGKMAKNREMLKEAIAEAKAVKEAAIANAKAALEEAFTPQLKSMLSLKLHEMEEEDIKEYAEEQPDRDMDGDGDVDANDVAMMKEVDLEELLAELEKEEDTLNEAEEEGEEEGEEEEGEEGDMEMEDLSDDEIKEMIEDVIAQMIKDGELEAGPEFGGEEEGEEMEMGAEEEEEVDLAELLREIEEMEEEGMYEEKEETNEIFGIKPRAVKELESDFPGIAKEVEALESKEEKTKLLGSKINDPKFKNGYPSSGDWRNAVTSIFGFFKLDSPFKPGSDKGSLGVGALEETDTMKDELEEAYKTINALRSELNEINLLNAKLLYSNKIFKAKNLNENQKVKVLSSFDKAKNVGEVKMVYETLNEGIKVAKTTIKENLGRASKSTVTPTAKQPIVESNDVFKRMQKLAGII
jgi:hypothetical protein